MCVGVHDEVHVGIEVCEAVGVKDGVADQVFVFVPVQADVGVRVLVGEKLGVDVAVAVGLRDTMVMLPTAEP